MKISLGFTSPYGGGIGSAVPEEASEKPQVVYPSLTVSDDAADSLVAKGVRPGDTVTALVTFRVVEVTERVAGQREYEPPAGCRIDLEARDFDQVETSKEGDEEEESADDAFESYAKKAGLARKTRD